MGEALLSAQAWLVPIAAVAAVAFAAAIMLLREHTRLERHYRLLQERTTELEARLTALGDRPGPGRPHAKSFRPVKRAPTARIEQNVDSMRPAAEPLVQLGRVPRILLVEDDDANALLAVGTLKGTGAILERARDGREAVDLMRESFSGARAGYDLVLMDLRMPNLDGFEATRRIRAMEAGSGQAARLPIVAVTATAMPRDQEAAFAAGVDSIVLKPYQPRELIRLIGMSGDLNQTPAARVS
jgi:CheY-like chemotaxis protein